MNRFLRYSLENEKKIRAVIMIDGTISQMNLIVTAFSGDTVSFTDLKRKKEMVLPFSAFLSADYAKGDKGEG